MWKLILESCSVLYKNTKSFIFFVLRYFIAIFLLRYNETPFSRLFEVTGNFYKDRHDLKGLYFFITINKSEK